MNFLSPMAFIGLVSLPIIITMYLLKQKYTEKVVPSVFLWHKAQALSMAQRPWQKLRRSLLMLLQLLLALLAVFALAGPYFASQSPVDSYVLVLDASLSMRAIDDAPSRFEKAKEEMSGLVTGSRPDTRFSVVVADANPYIAINNSSDKKTILDRIKSIEAGYTGVDEKTLSSIVNMLTESEGGAVYVYSDRIYDFGSAGEAEEQSAPVRTEKRDILFGGDADNMAIVLVASSYDGDRVVALVKVKNYGHSAASNSVALYCDGVFLDVKDVNISAGDEQDVFFTDVPGDTRVIEAKLSREDFLAADDTGYNVVQAPPTRRVVLVTERNVFLENVLSLMPGVELFKASPENVGALTGYYLYVFDGVMPEIPPADGHILVFNPPAGNALIETSGETAVVSELIERDSTLLNFIGGFRFDVSKTKEITTPSWADVVLESGEAPLILSGQADSRKIVVMGFDLHDTDLPLRKEFPIFMYNLIQYFIPAGAVTDGHIRTGDPVTVSAYPDAKKIAVATPGEEMITIAPPFPAQPFTGALTPGIYTVAQETAEGGAYDSFAVNTPEEESDLTRGEGEAGQGGAFETAIPVNRNLTIFFLIPALFILLLEWWVFTRGR